MSTLPPTTAAVKPLPSDVAAWLQARGFRFDQLTGKWTRHPEFVVAPEPTIQQRYRAGFDAYCAGAYYDEVAHDPHMLRGFRAALDAQAACESGYDVKAGW